MNLKNITSYKAFRRTFEEASIPSEFSNTTTFSQSLMGRGFFSIIRYFKKGINIGRLEYLSRKLENEYFAGWLRFCALNNVDIKDGTWSGKEEGKDENEEDTQGENVADIERNSSCEIFNVTSNNELDGMLKDLSGYTSSLEEMKVDASDDDKVEIDKIIESSNKLISYIQIKMKINDVFNNINNFVTTNVTSTGITLTDTTTIIQLLDQIITFVNGDAKLCSTYQLESQVEKPLIEKLNTCTNQDVQEKCKSILQPSTNENLKYNDYETLNEEAISSSLNPKIPITQILGDTLNITSTGASGSTSNKVNPYDYLKGIGVNSVDEINFKACVETWGKHPDWKEKTTTFVSEEGVRKIQYAASRIIYRDKSVPAGHGEKEGGLNYEEDSSLRTAWERKVEKCKGEWTYFMNVNKVDPFVLMSLQEAVRKRNDSNYENYNRSVGANTRPAEDAAVIDEGFGLKKITGPYKDEGGYFVIQYLYGNNYENISYLVCRMNTTDAVTTYSYLGNIDVDKIKSDKIKDKSIEERKRLVRNYTSSIISPDYNSKGDTNFNNYFKIIPSNYISGALNLNNIILAKVDFERISSKDPIGTTANNTKMFFVYLNPNDQSKKQKFGEASGSATKDNTTLKIFDNGNLMQINPIAGLKGLDKKIKSKTGVIYTFEHGWADLYFPNSNDLRLYADKNRTYLKEKIFITANM